jgi:hypothetical protein
MIKILTVALFFFSCKSGTERNVALKTHIEKDTINTKMYEPVDTFLQKKIVDTLMQLSFIKKSNRYIDSSTNHKHGISFIMDTLQNEPFIFVKAGVNGEDRFVTGCQLYVNPKNMEILVYDAVNDKRLPIKQFEKNNK